MKCILSLSLSLSETFAVSTEFAEWEREEKKCTRAHRPLPRGPHAPQVADIGCTAVLHSQTAVSDAVFADAAVADAAVAGRAAVTDSKWTGSECVRLCVGF